MTINRNDVMLTILKSRQPRQGGWQGGFTLFNHRFHWQKLAALDIRWTARAWFTNEVGGLKGRSRPWIIRRFIRKWMHVYYRFFMM